MDEFNLLHKEAVTLLDAAFIIISQYPEEREAFLLLRRKAEEKRQEARRIFDTTEA